MKFSDSLCFPSWQKRRLVSNYAKRLSAAPNLNFQGWQQIPSNFQAENKIWQNCVLEDSFAVEQKCAYVAAYIFKIDDRSIHGGSYSTYQLSQESTAKPLLDDVGYCMADYISNIIYPSKASAKNKTRSLQSTIHFQQYRVYWGKGGGSHDPCVLFKLFPERKVSWFRSSQLYRPK